MPRKISVNKRNAKGYSDPTAYEALTAALRKETTKAKRQYRPLVYICSPFAGDIERNTLNTRRFCRFALNQGAIPLAPHLHYPQFMDDANPAEREDGLWFALVLLGKVDEVWVFGKRISKGMKREIAKARKKGIPLRFYTNDCEVLHNENTI